MLCSKILVAYDFSELAKKALEKALEIGEMNPDIEIHVLHVVTVPEIARSCMEYSALVDAIYQEGKDIISKAEISLSKLPNPSQSYLLEGKSPARVILDYAQKYHCDLIIMGNRGMSGLKVLLGSVSHKVLQSSSCAVLIIK
jgi:Universal stress protein UspA and related nucleotide-binding proteins